MSIDMQFSGGNDIRGYKKDIVSDLCEHSFKDQSGWLHMHFKEIKEKVKGKPRVLIQANSLLDDRKITAKAEGFGVEPTVRDVLQKMSLQLARRAHS